MEIRNCFPLVTAAVVETASLGLSKHVVGQGDGEGGNGLVGAHSRLAASCAERVGGNNEVSISNASNRRHEVVMVNLE